MTSSIDDFNSSECRKLQHHEGWEVLIEIAEYVRLRFKQFDKLAEASEPASMARGAKSAYGDVLERLILEVGRYRDET